MNSIAFLKAAYAVAWIIYVGYLAQILLRMRRVEEELKEVESGELLFYRRPASSREYRDNERER